MSKYKYTGPEQFKPLSPWTYVGYTILFCVPIAGFILLVASAFNGNNINRRNYARSFFCMLLVVVVFTLALGASRGMFRGTPSETVSAVLSGIQSELERYTGRITTGASDRQATAPALLTDTTDNTMVPVKVGGIPLQIRQSFKAVMDSYEAFFDEYIDAINSNSTTKRASYLAKYAETMESLEKLEDEDLTDSELAYYTEVSARIQQKLIRSSAE